MLYTLPLTSEELERRLLKVSDLAVHPAIQDGTNIKVALEHFIEDGSEIKFKAPVDCSAVSRLAVQYTDKEGQTLTKYFAFADANGNDVGEVNNLFTAGAIVKVILDLDPVINLTGVDGAAFVQNADTNAYLEEKFAEVSEQISAKAASEHSHDDKYYTETEIDDKLNAKADKGHSHVIVESDLDAALAEKVNAASEGNHAHLNKGILDNITEEKVSAWDASLESAKEYTNTIASGKADTTHNQSASTITSGTLSSDRLPTVPASKGGTGETTLQKSAYALVNSISTSSSAPDDEATFITEGVGASYKGKYYRRPMSALWTYIKPKADSEYAALEHAHQVSEISDLTATAAELNYVSGVTSNVQTQLNTLNGRIPDSLSDLSSDSNHRTVTDTEKAAWNAKSSFSGNYNDLTDKPTDLATEAYVNNAVSDKVVKVDGKSLSTNDYTTAEKNKLSGIEAGAQVNTITGVKGESETNYRTGNVNITKANIGLDKVNNTADADKNVKYATSAGSATNAGKVGHTLTVGSKVFNGSANVEILASDLGLEQAMKFLGTSSTAISNGSTTATITVNSKSVTAAAGNVVLYNGYEYVWTGSAWEQLGQEGSFSLKTHTHTVSHTPAGSVSQPTFTGTEAGHTHSFSGSASHNHSFTGTAASHNHTFTGTGTLIKAAFTGTEQTASVSYTPAGSVSTPTITITPNTATVNSITAVGTLPSLSYTADTASEITAWSAGSVPSLTYTEVEASKISAWSAGTAPSLTFTQGTLPSASLSGGSASLTGSVSTGPNRTVTLSHSHSNPTLTFSAGTLPTATFSAGSVPSLTYTTVKPDNITAWSAGSVPSLTYSSVDVDNITNWSAGSLPTKGSNTTVVTSIKSATSTQPTFTGTAATISHKHTPAGTIKVTAAAPGTGETANYTPAGSIENTSITPAGTVGSKSVSISGTSGETKITPAGTVSKPTFTGTAATLTTTAANS